MQQRNLPVTLILSEAPAAEGELADADVVIGDASSVDVLRMAGAAEARAVLAMRADDSDNAFIVLAIKELEGSAKTVAAVNDSKNYSRVKRVQPDMIIAPQILGGELLAMALAGEPISGDEVMKRFFNT
jgi:voltage-gated potassium channel